MLTKVQYGLEGTHGDAVAADTMLLCRVGMAESDREIQIPQVDMGVRTPGLLAAAIVRKLIADGMTLEDADGAYFELFPLLFSLGIVTETATEQNSEEGDYLWDFPAPQTGAETLDSMTLEVGDGTQDYEIEYVQARSIRITGDCISGECHVSADLYGRQVTLTTLTASLDVPTAEMVNSKLARLYIDDTWAAVGTNEVAAALINFDILINGGAHPKFQGAANRYFTSHGQGAITAEATFTLERNAAVAAEELNYRPASGFAQTERFVELKIAGTQIGEGDVQSLVINLAGLWTAWNSLGGEEEGDTLDVVTLTAGYDTTGEQAVQAQVTTTVAAI